MTKPNLLILLLFIFIGSLSAQKYKLIDTKHFQDNSKNCEYIGNCVSAKYLKNYTLHLTAYINNNGRDLNVYRHSFSYKTDTLSLNLIDTNRVVKIRRYNKSKKRMVTSISQSYSMHDLYGPDFQQFKFTLTGFTKIPKAIQFDYATLCDCPTKSIKFEICDNDTINMINVNGYKQGTWIEFYDTGEIKTKREYKNDEMIGGYSYDKQAKAPHKLQQMGEMEVEEIIIETK